MSFSGSIVPQLPVGGIDTSQGPQNIDDGHCADCRNVRFFQGDIRQRLGYATYIAGAVAASPVTGLYQMTFKSGATRFVAAAGSALVKDGGSGSWTSIKGALTFTSGAANLFSFARVNNLLIGTNGVDPLWQYNDSTDPAVVVTGSPPTVVKCVTDFYNRVVALNMTWSDGTVSPARIGWSVINNPNDWANFGSGFAEPVLNAGQVGRGIGKVGNEAFIFFDQSIYRMVPTGDGAIPFQFPAHDQTVGAVNQQSIVTAPTIGTLFFVGPRGIYQMQTPSYRPTRISKPLDGIWDNVNKTKLAGVVAAVFAKKNEVWFAVPYGSGTTNNMVLVYDYERNAWTVFDNLAANFLASYLDGSSIGQIAHGDLSGFVFSNETGSTDNGTTHTAYLTSKAYPTVDGVRRGRVPWMEFNLDAQGANSTLNVSGAYDLGPLSALGTISMDSGGANWDSATFDQDVWAAENQIIERLNCTGQGRFFQWQILNNLQNTVFRCYRVSLGVISEKREKVIPQ